MLKEKMGIELVKDVLKLESDAILTSISRLNHSSIDRMIEIYKSLMSNNGKLVFIGVGKSGWIANKLAATFSSLGLNSIFLHPTEALHGDLGRVSAEDAVVLISKSGSSEEIQKLIPFLPTKKDFLIGLLGNMNSPLAEICHVLFDCSVEKEACLNNQAPTTSSTLALAMGDALAVLFEKFIGLSSEKFAIYHPGGALGKSLLLTVEDLMWKPEKCPILSSESKLKDAILEMTSKNLGGCAVIDNTVFKGIVVEGDIRRTFAENENGLDVTLSDIMNSDPVCITPKTKAIDALLLMEKRKSQINILPVLENKKFLGFIRLHDLLGQGFKSS